LCKICPKKFFGVYAYGFSSKSARLKSDFQDNTDAIFFIFEVGICAETTRPLLTIISSEVSKEVKMIEAISEDLSNVLFAEKLTFECAFCPKRFLSREGNFNLMFLQ
jgi:hypothetical protein